MKGWDILLLLIILVSTYLFQVYPEKESVIKDIQIIEGKSVPNGKEALIVLNLSSESEKLCRISIKVLQSFRVKSHNETSILVNKTAIAKIRVFLPDGKNRVIADAVC